MNDYEKVLMKHGWFPTLSALGFFEVIEDYETCAKIKAALDKWNDTGLPTKYDPKTFYIDYESYLNSRTQLINPSVILWNAPACIAAAVNDIEKIIENE